MQTVENRLGLPAESPLRRVAQTGGATAAAAELVALLAGVAVGLAVPLSIAAVVIAPLAAATRRSATIAVYAVRSPDQRE